MRLSKRCEYGIRAAVHLAQRHGAGYTQSREIAEAESLPAKFLESILLALRSASFLESKVGAGGGYRLARAPETIRVIDLIALLEPSESSASKQAALDAQEGVGSPAPVANGMQATSAIDVINGRLDEAIMNALGELDLSTLATLTAAAETRFDSPVVCC